MSDRDTPLELDPREAQLDAAWAEYLRGLDAGEPLDREEFLRRCGPHAEVLRELFDTADLIERMAGPPLADQPVLDDSTASWPAPASSDETQEFHSGRPDEACCDEPSAGRADASENRPVPSVRAPDRLGDYELLSEIGRGGMGVVYQARQMQLERIVAVKMILAGRFASADDVQRFYTEAQAAAKLDHPNVVAIYQVGEIEGHHYFSMDFIEGTDLASMLTTGPLAPELAAKYLAQIADAIDYAHRKGILHRDLKPANILIDELDRPLISDFGLAKYLGQHEGLTASGLAIGTPSYMSPEQAAGRQAEIGPAADVYALGALLYAMLTGQPPHRGDTPIDTIMKVLHDDPVPPSQLEAAARGDLETICLKCLQKDPKARYASAKELSDDLRRYLRDEPIEAKPAGTVVKTARWVLNIPLVAALTGRRVLEPTVAHRRVQSTLLGLMLLIPLLFFSAFAASRVMHNRLPATIRIATGTEDGVYHDFGGKLAETLGPVAQRPVVLSTTSGSGANREALRGGAADLALLQASAVRGPTVAVVAPLYYEAVHVLVRREEDITEIPDLAGKRVVVGAPGSGSWLSARTILDHYGLSLDALSERGELLTQLRDGEAFDAAIITMGVGSDGIRSLLNSGEFMLLSIDDSQTISLNHVAYRPFLIRPADYGNPPSMRDEGISTIATTAFLAARADAPDVLVERALESLYSASFLNGRLIPRESAAEWQGMALHPAARRYYEEHSEND